MMIFRGGRKQLLNKFLFSQEITTSYPYRFGGVELKSSSMTMEGFLIQQFGSNILNNLKTAYVSVLEGLAEKNKTMLNENLSKKLIPNNFLDVELINQTSDIKVSTHSGFFMIGERFQRNSPTVGETKMPGSREDFRFFMAKQFADPKKCPFIVGFQIYFTGATKLKLKDSPVTENSQTHMVQFEIAKEIDAYKIITLSQSQDRNLSEIIGDDFEWKVGDIDSTLNMNLQII